MAYKGKGTGCLNYSTGYYDYYNGDPEKRKRYRQQVGNMYTTIKSEPLNKICLQHLAMIATHLGWEEMELKHRLNRYLNDQERFYSGELTKIAEWFGVRTDVFCYYGPVGQRPEPTTEELNILGITTEEFGHRD